MIQSTVRRRDHLRLLARRRGPEPAPTEGHDYDAPSPTESTRTVIRVLIAASQAVARAGYRAVLESHSRIEIVAEAFDSHHAVRLARETRPHVALVDLADANLDDSQGIAAMVSLQELTARAVMIIAPPNSEEHVLRALQAGANGVLLNDAEPAELIAAVLILASGKAFLPAVTMRRLLNELAPPSGGGDFVLERFNELTDRERQVAALVATGLTNTEIAERLVISTATAKTHVSRAMIKLNARHRAQLVAMAFHIGLVRASATTRPLLEARGFD